MRSRISFRGFVRPSVRPSHTRWNNAKVPFLTKTTISTSENASYGRVSGLVQSCLVSISIRDSSSVLTSPSPVAFWGPRPPFRAFSPCLLIVTIASMWRIDALPLPLLDLALCPTVGECRTIDLRENQIGEGMGVVRKIMKHCFWDCCIETTTAGADWGIEHLRLAHYPIFHLFYFFPFFIE